MGFLAEFRKFALRGNVVDLAVGVVIGAAFSKIVASLVDDIITPAILTPALQAANISNLADLKVPGTGIRWGNFVSTLISFLIIALSLFLIIKAINGARKKEVEAPPPEPTNTEKLLMEIRDSLKK
jgi:large conductance mechanosensitive channel